MSAHHDLASRISASPTVISPPTTTSAETSIFAVAKSSPEGADDVEVPFRGDRIDLGCCISAEARDMTVGTPPR
jgi:hypothetical protein